MFSGYNDLIIQKRITFLGYSFHRWNVCGAYAIRPYRVTGKRIAFLRYNDLIIRKRITFLGYSFHRWNVCGAYAIRPYCVTRKRIAFLRYKDLIIWKCITFWIFIFDEWWKRGSFSGYNNHIIRKRITFSGYIDLGIWKSGALPPFPYLLFFPWWKKRRQKKIKASAEAGEVDRVHDWSWKRIDFLRSNVGAYCIRPTGCHPEDGECAKRIAFLRYNDLIIRKRTTF